MAEIKNKRNVYCTIMSTFRRYFAPIGRHKLIQTGLTGSKTTRVMDERLSKCFTFCKASFLQMFSVGSQKWIRGTNPTDLGNVSTCMSGLSRVKTKRQNEISNKPDQIYSLGIFGQFTK